MLRVTAYKKTFGDALVLKLPQLELEPNIYWLRGENGSGKTTFLKSAAGLLPFEGDISVSGISIKKKRRDYTTFVNHAPAEPQYPPFLTGQELIKFYLGTKGGTEKPTEELAASFGMHYLTKQVNAYSSGMTKKLSLLLAFTGQPKLILLDEPFTTLDAEAVEVLQQLIARRFSTGVCFCISSHQALLLPHTVLEVKNKTIVRR